MANNSVVEHVGKIIEIDNSIIKVEILNKSMCAGCHAKSMCAMGDAKEKVIDIPHLNSNEYVVGEEVNVVMKKSMGFKAVWISYVLPLLLLIVFLLLLQGLRFSDLMAGLISIAVIAVYYSVIYIFRAKIATQFTFKIVKKYKN